MGCERYLMGNGVYRKFLFLQQQQAISCFIELAKHCQQCTCLFFLVRLDKRTGKVISLAGEETEISIDRNGTRRFSAMPWRPTHTLI